MTWLMYFADDGSLREFMFWMMGSLSYGSQQLGWWWLVLPLTLGWLCWQGLSVQILGEGAAVQGSCLGVDDDGSLLLDTAQGVERIFSGDVSLRRSGNGPAEGEP